MPNLALEDKQVAFGLFLHMFSLLAIPLLLETRSKDVASLEAEPLTALASELADGALHCVATIWVAR